MTMVSLLGGIAALCILDGIYLTVNRRAFERQIERVQRSPLVLKWWSVLLCYAFIICGLYYFIWRERRSIYDAALLGVVIYGIYDTTTISLLKDWSATLAAIDVLWGGFLFAASTWAFNIL